MVTPPEVLPAAAISRSAAGSVPGATVKVVAPPMPQLKVELPLITLRAPPVVTQVLPPQVQLTPAEVTVPPPVAPR
ncbi:MAG: hypothetical protein U1G05_10385 [Kiritimatiellia bacterium]